MANGIFGVGAPLGPPVQGMTPMVNPLSVLGAGIYQGNPLQAMQMLGNMQSAAATLAQQQAYQNALLENARANLLLRAQKQATETETRERLLGAVPSAVLNFIAPDAAKRGASLTAEQRAEYEAMLPVAEANPKDFYARWLESRGLSRGAPVQVNVGPQAPSVPTGYVAVQDPQSAVGWRAERIPGTFQPTAEEARQRAQAESAIEAGEALAELVTSQKVNPEGIAGLWAQYRARPEILPQLMNWLDPISKDESNAVLLAESLKKNLIAALRGASVGPEEEASFMSALPVFGQQNFLSNLQTTLDNIELLNRRQREIRGQTSTGQSGQPTATGFRVLSIDEE